MGILKMSLKWKTLSILGENRLVKSSYIWFIAVPVLAKLLSEMPKEVVLNNGLIIKMSLPFS